MIIIEMAPNSECLSVGYSHGDKRTIYLAGRTEVYCISVLYLLKKTPLGSYVTRRRVWFGLVYLGELEGNPFIYPKRVLNKIPPFPTIMAHSSYHEKLGTDDSDVTAFSLSYNGGKHILDVSHAASEFPEIFNTSTNPIDEHDKPSSRRREETLDSRRYPPFIPSELENPDPGRTLVLCFDGTGDQFDADNSNVVQLVSLLKKNDSTKQLVYYQVRFSNNKKKTPFFFFFFGCAADVELCGSF